MESQIGGIVVMILIALGSIGCSSSPRVYYAGGKGYAKNPVTGKTMSWEHKVSEGSGFEEYEDGSGLGYVVTDVLDCIVN